MIFDAIVTYQYYTTRCLTDTDIRSSNFDFSYKKGVCRKPLNRVGIIAKFLKNGNRINLISTSDCITWCLRHLEVLNF